MNHPDTTVLLTIPQAAKQLTVSSSMIRKLLDQGVLTRVRIGRSVRVKQSELDAYINQETTHGTD